MDGNIYAIGTAMPWIGNIYKNEKQNKTRGKQPSPSQKTNKQTKQRTKQKQKCYKNWFFNNVYILFIFDKSNVLHKIVQFSIHLEGYTVKVG